MKAYIACDWQEIQHPVLGKSRFPSVAVEYGLKPFQSHDGADGRAVCEFDCGEELLAKIVGNPRFQAVTPDDIPCHPENKTVPVFEVDRPTPEDFPCIHRGKKLRQVGCGCSEAERKIQVYACKIEGECTVESAGKVIPKKRRPPDTQADVPACIGCNAITANQPPETFVMLDNQTTDQPAEPAAAAVVEADKTVDSVLSNAEAETLTPPPAPEPELPAADPQAPPADAAPAVVPPPEPKPAEPAAPPEPKPAAASARKTIKFHPTIRNPVAMAVLYHDSLTANDPRRLPDFIITGLRRVLTVMDSAG